MFQRASLNSGPGRGACGPGRAGRHRYCQGAGPELFVAILSRRVRRGSAARRTVRSEGPADPPAVEAANHQTDWHPVKQHHHHRQATRQALKHSGKSGVARLSSAKLSLAHRADFLRMCSSSLNSTDCRGLSTFWPFGILCIRTIMDRSTTLSAGSLIMLIAIGANVEKAFGSWFSPTHR